MDLKLDLSLVIITLNEEDNVERCIRSVPFAKEIIVLDSGSTDRTKEIAKTLGAKVYHQDWQGYGAQKHLAVEKASSRWILSLDADEWLSDGLADEIKEIIERDGLGSNIFSMRRLSQYMDRWIYYGGWFPDRQVRLFRKGVAEWNPGATIHESIETKEHIAKLSGVIYHKPFESIKEQVDVNFRYAKLIAEKKFKQGKRLRSAYPIVFKTMSRFIENFFIKRGYKDGIRGFIIALNSAQSYMVQLYYIYKKSLEERSQKY